MDLNTTLALAKANGWSDDSRWTRSTIESQISSIIDGWQATVSVWTNGAIRWTIRDESAQQRGQGGTAADVEAAMSACRSAITATAGTLFVLS